MSDQTAIENPAAESYDPASDLMNLKGKAYLEVKNRLKWLRDAEPLAKIITEALELTADRAVFRAHVMTPAGAEATGHGSETPRDFSDYIEKAETKAIGRALAALGYGTQFVESELEGKQGPRPVDSPAQRGNSAQAPQNRSGRAENGSRDNQSRRPAQSRTAPQNAPQPAAPADDVISADQIAFILRLAGEKGFTAETLAAGIAKYFPGSTIETLTSKHAAELIDKLNEAPPKKA